MRTKTLFVLVAVASIFLSSCAKIVYFNQDIKGKLASANIQPTDLQFYTDEKIVLRKDFHNSDTKIESGKVKFENGQKIEFLIFKAKTPGICKSYTDDELKIAFEEGDGKVLTFKKLKNGGKVGQYQLVVPQPNSNENIIYGGFNYTLHEHGRTAKLKIAKSNLDNVTVKKNRVKGLRVSK